VTAARGSFLTVVVLHTVAEACDRFLWWLNKKPDGAPLEQLLPNASPDGGDASRRALRRRSGWGLNRHRPPELPKQGDVVMKQQDTFEPIHLTKT
jgi:hypothetical protein